MQIHNKKGGKVNISDCVKAKTQHEQKWENFKGISKSLTKVQRDQLAKAWTEKYNDKPKPTSALDVDSETLDFLITQAVAAQLGGNVVPV